MTRPGTDSTIDPRTRPIPHRSWRDLPAAPPTAEQPAPLATPQPVVEDFGPDAGDEPPTEPTDVLETAGAPKPKRRLRIVAAALIVVVLLAAVAFVATRDSDDNTAGAALGDEPVQDVAAALAPSVVHIETAIGVGAGVVVDDGLVLTAAHVVAGVDEVTIKADDGSEQDGRVVGRAPERDLAVVALDDPDSIPAAPLADEPFEVGQQVVAVGSPFGFAQSVSAGVVSALDRELETPNGTLTGLIQTDTAINPGNSGGPLADLDGNVGGIATAIATASGGSEGVGFAVPVADAADLLEQVRNAGGADAPTVPDAGGSSLGGQGLDDLLGGQGLDDLLGGQNLDDLLGGQNLDDLLGGQNLDDLLGSVPELQQLLDDLLGGATPGAPADPSNPDESEDPQAAPSAPTDGVVSLDNLPEGYDTVSSRVFVTNDQTQQQSVLDGPDGTVLLLAERGPDAADRFAGLEGDDVSLGDVDARVSEDSSTTRYAWMADDDVLVVLVVPEGVARADVEALAAQIEVIR
ncbi:MAG: trypsin-like peptidase domain-containing protein [Acidimicrobiia bacterium]